jgi:hypothetical protein
LRRRTHCSGIQSSPDDLDQATTAVSAEFLVGDDRQGHGDIVARGWQGPSRGPARIGGSVLRGIEKIPGMEWTSMAKDWAKTFETGEGRVLMFFSGYADVFKLKLMTLVDDIYIEETEDYTDMDPDYYSTLTTQERADEFWKYALSAAEARREDRGY